jgi:hypothetical protein
MAMIELNEQDYLQIVYELVKSNNEQEERIRKLEPAQQSLKIEGICHCSKPMTGLGSKNCLRCGDVLVQQA